MSGSPFRGAFRIPGFSNKLVSRSFHPEDTIIEIGAIRIGGEEVVIMAGPCSVESEVQIHQTRPRPRWPRPGPGRSGGTFKPRSNPCSFQGPGEKGLELLRDAADEHGLLVITEPLSPNQVESVAGYADIIIQVGARNMRNVPLLNELGGLERPVVLKRGL